jgi:hypothetical protein
MGRLVIGIALCLLGVVWIGQGIGWIEGSFMTGVAFWAVMGVVCVLIGGALLRGYWRDRGNTTG